MIPHLYVYKNRVNAAELVAALSSILNIEELHFRFDDLIEEADSLIEMNDNGRLYVNSDGEAAEMIGRQLAEIVVSVLVQPVPGPVPSYAVGTPAFVIPYDEALRDPGTLAWQAISPATRQAVVALAAALAEPLRAAA